MHSRYRGYNNNFRHYDRADHYDGNFFDEEDFLVDEEDDELPDLRIPSSQLPSRLWRVHLPERESATPYSPSHGFGRPRTGSSQGISILKRSQLVPAVQSHLNWSSVQPSPFISTFIRRSHAELWGKRWLRKHQEFESVDLMEIDPRRITNDRGVPLIILSALEVVDFMPEEDLLPEWMAEDQIEDELLCMYQIRRSAIVNTHTLRLDENDRDFVIEEEKDDEHFTQFRNHRSSYRSNRGRRSRTRSNRAPQRQTQRGRNQRSESPPSRSERSGNQGNAYQCPRGGRWNRGHQNINRWRENREYDEEWTDYGRAQYTARGYRSSSNYQYAYRGTRRY